MVEATLEVLEACRSCRFGRGEDRACLLLQSGDVEKLFAQGPCNLDEEVRKAAHALVRRRYPFARSIEEDVASDVLLRVYQSENLLVPDRIHHLPVLYKRMREVVRNAVIDVLRQHRMITRLRCGACVNFDAATDAPGCQLESLPDPTGEPCTNPWFGAKVERTSDPRSLKPPCPAFTWRRPDTHDIFEEEIPGMNPEGTARERAVSLLVRAIDRLSQKDASGMRVASVLFWHYLRGKEVKVLAAESQVSEKTIKRLLADGRERLLDVLRDDFAIEDPAEIF